MEYKKVASHEVKENKVKSVVLLYSGGLDSSVMLKWIQQEYQAEVVALTINVGQQADDLEAIRQKALHLGAKKAIALDVREEFAKKCLVPAIKANASYQGDYHLSTPLARPFMAQKAVEIAQQENIKIIAHGATGKGNDQVRIESAVLCLDPEMKIIAPVREWSMGREEEAQYALKHGIEIKSKTYSWDDNMWGVTGEGGVIEDPKIEPPLEEILQATTLPEQAPDKPEYLEISFQQGVPTAVNNQPMNLVDLIKFLNKKGGQHGVGFTTLIEDRLVGLKVRGVYEAPAAHILVTAHYNLEKIVSTQTENAFKETIDSKWSYLCYNSQWFEPTMKHLNQYIDSMNKKVTGQVKIKLFKGRADVISVISPFSLFDADLATFQKNDKFNQNASAGFIEIYSLAMKTASLRDKE